MPGIPRYPALFIWFCFETGKLPASATAAAPETAPDWNSLPAAEVQKSFQLLRRAQPENGALSQESLNRAALRGLLEHEKTGAAILTTEQAAKEAAPSAPLCAKLSDSSVYVRPGWLMPDHLLTVRHFLTGQPPEVTTLVLDLRAPSAPRPLAPVADFAGLFLPEKTPLFSLPANGRTLSHVSAGAPCWNRRLWLLVDAETPNDLELAALILARRPHTLIIGGATAGRAAEFEEIPLGTGHLLRVATASPVLADGTRAAGRSVTPGFAIAADQARKHHLFSLTDPAALLPALRETDRPHHNEAALMAGTDPELPARLAGPPPAPVLPDPVLQQTRDLLETSAFLHLDQPPAAGQPAGTGVEEAPSGAVNRPPDAGK
ncbi:MAG: hypothetical protein V4726_14620 [Verrucomicrobiota bacterium]